MATRCSASTAWVVGEQQQARITFRAAPSPWEPVGGTLLLDIVN